VGSQSPSSNRSCQLVTATNTGEFTIDATPAPGSEATTGAGTSRSSPARRSVARSSGVGSGTGAGAPGVVHLIWPVKVPLQRSQVRSDSGDGGGPGFIGRSKGVPPPSEAPPGRITSEVGTHTHAGARRGLPEPEPPASPGVPGEPGSCRSTPMQMSRG